MIALPKIRSVADLMEQCELELEELAQLSGLGPTVVSAIVNQRYTPSPEQRNRISNVLGVEHEQVMWGHRDTVDAHIHSPD